MYRLIYILFIAAAHARRIPNYYVYRGEDVNMTLDLEHNKHIFEFTSSFNVSNPYLCVVPFTTLPWNPNEIFAPSFPDDQLPEYCGNHTVNDSYALSYTYGQCIRCAIPSDPYNAICLSNSWDDPVSVPSPNHEDVVRRCALIGGVSGIIVPAPA
jgi:hypothetical protein